MPDTIDELFSNIDKFYPGSKRVRKSMSFPEPKTKQETEGWESQGKVKTLSNGKTVELFSAGSLSLALNRPLVTVRLWERKGYIPRAPYRLKARIVDGKKEPGWRMYSRAMIESTITSFQSRNLLEAPRIDWNRHTDLSVELLENWTKIHNTETE